MTPYKLLISALLLCLLAFSSCKKEYRCYCTNGSSYTVKETKKKYAVTSCTKYDDYSPYSRWTCKLDE